MPVGLAALGISAGVKLIGGLIGGRRRRKAAEALARREAQRREEIRLAGEENLKNVSGAFKSSFETIANMEDLNIDTKFVDAQFSDAQRNAQRQFGRSFGEEIARDSVRQSTADSIGRGRQAGGSTADLLGFIGDAEQRERNAMSNIDFEAIQARETRIDRAMERLEAAGANRADFYQQKELAEFQSEQSQAQLLAQFQQQAGLTIADIKNQNALNLIEGSDAIASSNAAVQNVRAGNTDALFGGLSDSLFKIGEGILNRETEAA